MKLSRGNLEKRIVAMLLLHPGQAKRLEEVMKLPFERKDTRDLLKALAYFGPDKMFEGLSESVRQRVSQWIEDVPSYVQLENYIKEYQLTYGRQG